MDSAGPVTVADALDVVAAVLAVLFVRKLPRFVRKLPRMRRERAALGGEPLPSVLPRGAENEDDRGRHPPQERPRSSSTGPQDDPVFHSAPPRRFLSHRTLSEECCRLYKPWTYSRVRS